MQFIHSACPGQNLSYVYWNISVFIICSKELFFISSEFRNTILLLISHQTSITRLFWLINKYRYKYDGLRTFFGMVCREITTLSCADKIF